MQGLLITWGLAMGIGLAGAMGEPPTPPTDTPPASAPASAPADTLREVILMPRVVITASRLDRLLGAGQVRLGEQAIAVTDGRAIADLALLLPSTQAAVNSRGEALFMVRGASERHLPVFLEGIPLTVPWDERADLSMIPTDAIAGVDATRGVHSVLDGPNALAGVIHLVPAEQLEDGQHATVTGQIGEAEHVEAHTTYTRRQGDWHTLAALAHRRWSAWLVPADVEAPFHQPPRRARTNSDLSQTALTMRVGREWGSGARLNLLLLAAEGSKGVPPESHLGVDDARFWRYPEHQRAVLGVTGQAPLDEARRWDLQASASFDVFRQEIRAYDDASYTTPVLAPGVDYETDRDQTGYAQIQVGRRMGSKGRVTTKGVARYTRHGETLKVGEPELFYSEWITSLTAEAARELGEAWQIIAGAGIEGATTPETGDKPARDATTAPVLQGRIERRWGEGLEAYASASQRSRFPSLRELYSGALGKFVPNPDLEPERQDLYEVGALADGTRGEVGFAAFAGYLHGGIEKVSLGGGKFQRVNVHEIRTLGLELFAGWRPLPSLRLQANHTVLQARRQENGAYTLPAEDRPDYVGTFTAGWTPAGSLDLQLEAGAVGPRYSIDATDTEDGLRRLPAYCTWNLRLAHTLCGADGWAASTEIFVRINNLFDQFAEYQTGLTGPGRMVLAGVKLDLGR